MVHSCLVSSLCRFGRGNALGSKDITNEGGSQSIKDIHLKDARTSMGKLLWAPDYGLGGMAKAVWLLVEQGGGISVEQLVAECGIGSTTDVEAALERLGAAGLVSSGDITTLQEHILVMDWLRSVDAIGDNCMDVDADFLHPPDQCLEESMEYESWERNIRAAGEPGYGLTGR